MSVSPAQNFSKPPPVPEIADRDLDVGVLLAEQLGGRLGERADRAGAVDRDRAGEVAATAAVVVVAAGADGQCERQRP